MTTSTSSTRFDAFVNTMRGVSIAAIHKGMPTSASKDNEVIIFSELMDAKSLFLTANADTIYFIGVLDLTKGPMVLEAAAQGARARSTTAGCAG